MSIVTITAGHGNGDPGAVNGWVTEAEIATDMRNIIKFYLERDGITVRTDGTGNTNKSLSEAIKLIKGSKLAVEIHCNSFHLPTARGVEALAQRKDRVICQKLCKAVSDVMGIPIRGGEGGFKSEGSGQHSRLGYVRNGGIILELFFLSNPSELKIYQAKKWLIAREIAGVIRDHVR